jgi:hypothetical protein
MRDCKACLGRVGSRVIEAGVTPLYPGSHRTFTPTERHPEMSHRGVPDRKGIGCDWPYAIRRYNGAGPDSYHYQAEVLLRVLDGK